MPIFPGVRLSRLRKHSRLREALSETRVNPKKCFLPLFVVPGRGVQEPIPSLPGQSRLACDRLAGKAKELSTKGLTGVLLFGIPQNKDSQGSEAYAKDNIVCQGIQAIKDAAPDLLVATDVCLCSYTDHGHCGIVDEKGHIQNDPTLELLGEIALRHAGSGAELVSPSDMMDGRVGRIRKVLDQNGFQDTAILSHAAKFASSFFGPFRDATHCTPKFGDRRSYQANPANRREALLEIAEDIEEGADIVMVKPALPYLDVISEARRKFDHPIAAYQVSGEYVMIKALAEKNLGNEKELVLESLTAIQRAGADLIVTYFAGDLLDF